MLKKRYLVILFIFTIFISSLCIYIGYNLYDPINGNKIEESYIKNAETDLNILQNKSNLVSNIKIPKITPSTKMIYEYLYKDDKITETIEDVPPYFLIDLTREDIEKSFDEWQVKSFSEKEVVLQKIMEGKSTKHYIIGEYDGYLAVFYEKEINGTRLKEITDTPIESLSIKEKNEIKNGIKIKGDDELIHYLENFES